MSGADFGVLPWLSKHKNKIATAGCLSLAGLLSYRYLYANNNSSFAKLTQATQKYCEAYSNSAELVASLVNDLNTFVHSDNAELPQSLRQVAKLLQSEDVQATVKTFVNSAVSAVQESANSSPSGSSVVAETVDKIIAAVLSENGKNLVGLAVGMAAKNSTAAVCDFVGQRLDALAAAPSDGSSSSFSLDTILSLLTSERGERLIRVVVGESMSKGVQAYMDASVSPNYYDELFSSMAKSEHTQALREIFSSVSGSFAKELVTAYMTTPTQPPSTAMHQASTSYHSTVVTSAPSSPHAAAGSSSSDLQSDIHPDFTDFHDSVRSLTPKSTQVLLEKQNAQWLDAVVMLSRQPEVQTLAVDLTKSSVREAIGSVMQTLLPPDGEGNGSVRLRVNHMLQRAYTMISVLLSLLLYMCCR